MTRRAVVAAPAKVNLGLHVLARRDDGFHELRTTFQMIDFSDEVEVALTDGDVTLEMEGPDLGPVEDNLAYGAAQAFAAASGLESGIDIRLVKRIPAGAGLGGGSSDAAAVLRLLDHLTDGAVPEAALHRIAAELGSDVPFFLCDSPLASATGRGEVLEPMSPLPASPIYLALPPVHVATGPTYAALAEQRGDDWSNESRSVDVSSWAGITGGASNDFGPVVADMFPEVAMTLTALAAHGYALVMLSGSGGACFALDPDGSVGPPDSGPLAKLGWPVIEATTLTRTPSIREAH